MYYLSKFCRICIRTGVELVDIGTSDSDQVTFGQKLEFCTKMVINSESLSTQICRECVKKLRTSYEFHKMCRNSTKILQGYLTELISTSTKVTAENFLNSELTVTLTPLLNYKNSFTSANYNYFRNNSINKRKRITKEQRCSLLKKLLMSKKRGYKKQKPPPIHRNKKTTSSVKGGLRNIINFTRNFDFGYKIDGNHNNCQVLPTEQTPLTKLENFTNTFFINNFSDFENTVLYLIENRDNLSDSDDDQDMFETYIPQPEHVNVKSEEVIVEPDIKIKQELDYEDCDSYSCNYYVETSYSDSEIKKEVEIQENIINHNHYFHNLNSDNSGTSLIKQEFYQDPLANSSSVQMLDNLVGNLGRRSFSQHSVRCRTRGNPYINPTLRQQFQLKSFQCEKCNRYFKSPGYLKAHVSKVHS